MKKFLSAFLLLLLAACCALSVVGCGGKPSEPPLPEEKIPAKNAQTNVKVMTLNMAYPTSFSNGEIKYRGQTAADYTMQKRYTRFCALVDYCSPDVILLQEVNGKGAWWDYLAEGENCFLQTHSKYKLIGTKNLAGGTNGSGGERTLYNQIYYNSSKFELVDGGTFFCRNDKTSPENQFTGDYEGIYNSNNTTTCSYAVLRDKATLLTAVYATSHLCTRSSPDRYFRNYGQARNLTEGLYEIAAAHKWGEGALPVIVGGDFNGYESDENFYSYAHMTEEAHYTDSMKVAPEEDNSGTARIFGAALANNGRRLDYIFEQGAKVGEYRVLKGTFAEDKGQTYCEYNPEPALDGSEYDLSDHLPVFAKLELDAKGRSVAPDVYVNPRIAEDKLVTESSAIEATATKIVFDSVDLLPFVGNNMKKSFVPAIVEDGEGGKCLRLTLEKSRVDPCVSIDYAALMEHLHLSPASADDYRKIKIEYLYSATKAASNLHAGASTVGMAPVTVGVNTAPVAANGGKWTTEVFDFTAVDDVFWSGEFTYFGFITGVGMMAGDGIYIRSLELVA